MAGYYDFDNDSDTDDDKAPPLKYKVYGDELWYTPRPNDPEFPDDKKCGHTSTPSSDEYYYINRHASTREPTPHTKYSRCHCPECISTADWNVMRVYYSTTRKSELNDRVRRDLITDALSTSPLICETCSTSQNLLFLDQEDYPLCSKVLMKGRTYPRASFLVCDHFETFIQPAKSKLSNKINKELRNYRAKEIAAMQKAASETETQNELQRLFESIGAPGTATTTDTPIFHIGENIHQYWAPWMNDNNDAPLGVRQKQRASWYSGHILAVSQKPLNIKYSGLEYTLVWAYHVY